VTSHFVARDFDVSGYPNASPAVFGGTHTGHLNPAP
jgi:hypothetical protein